MGKKHAAVLLAVLCVFAGCGKTGNDAPALNDILGDSRESIYFNSYNSVVSSPDGYYTLQWDMGSKNSGSYLTYISKESGKETYLCSKPDCSHVDDSFFHNILESCDAYVGCAMPAPLSGITVLCTCWNTTRQLMM